MMVDPLGLMGRPPGADAMNGHRNREERPIPIIDVDHNFRFKMFDYLMYGTFGPDPWVAMNRGIMEQRYQSENGVFWGRVVNMAVSILNGYSSYNFTSVSIYNETSGFASGQAISESIHQQHNTSLRNSLAYVGLTAGQLATQGAIGFSEYLSSISLSTGIEVTLDLSSIASTALRGLSLTVSAMTIPLTAGAGSGLEERNHAVYMAACRMAANTGLVPLNYVHGNSDNNKNPHGVYVIYSGTGMAFERDIYKYGITGRIDFPDNRPESQVRKLNSNGSGLVYNYFWVAQNVPGRQMAKMIELYHVSHFYMQFGDIPLGNKRPNPVKNPIFLNK